MKKKLSKKIIEAAAIAIALAAGISIHSIAADYPDFTSVKIKSYGTFTYDDGDTSNDNGHEHDLFIDSADVVNLSNAVEELQQAFQDGVNKIYNKLAGLGFTPATKSPDDINEAVQVIYDSRYKTGCNDGSERVQDNAKIMYTYHQHTGSSTSGGGCYTKADYTVVAEAGCGAALYADKQEGQVDPDLYGGDCPNGNWGGGVHSPGPGWTTCTVHYRQVIIGYSLGCGMDSNTITGVTIEFTDIRKSSAAAAEDYPDFTSVTIQSYGTLAYNDGDTSNDSGHDNDLFIDTSDMIYLFNSLKELQTAFWNGINKIDNKLTGLGFTPEAKSPDSISEAIQDMSDSRYREGYIDGVAQIQSGAKITYTYHEHTGDSTTGGGCYTEANSENGTIYILDCGMSTNTIIGATIEFDQKKARLIESGTESEDD